LNKVVADLVSDFAEQNCERSKSIVLVGSHAFVEARNDSDVDLIVITSDVETAREVKNSIAKLQSASSNNSIDCKVYTEKGFAAAKSGKEHLFLWTALRNGSLLCEEDIRESIKLKFLKIDHIDISDNNILSERLIRCLSIMWLCLCRRELSGILREHSDMQSIWL